MHVLTDLEVQSQAVSRALLSLKSLGRVLPCGSGGPWLSSGCGYSIPPLPPLFHGGLLTVCLPALPLSYKDIGHWIKAHPNPVGFPGCASGEGPRCQCRRCKTLEFNPWVGKTPWSRKWKPTPVFLTPGESHGQRSPMGYSPWSCRESDTTEHMHITVPCDLNLTTSSGMLFPAKVTFTGSRWMWVWWGGWCWGTVRSVQLCSLVPEQTHLSRTEEVHSIEWNRDDRWREY